MYVGKEAVIYVRWMDGNEARFRVGKTRNIDSLVNNLIQKGCQSAKLYEYHRVNGTNYLGPKMGFFGFSKSTGAFYSGGVFSSYKG